IWETSLREIGSVTILWDGNAKAELREGDKLNAVFGYPGNLQKVSNYAVWRVRRGDRIEVVALEFGADWQAKTQSIYPGPRQAAIVKLLAKRGEKPGKIDVAGGDRTYAQNESDIAFLYRLSGNVPVWRDVDGAVNVADPPDVKIGEVIDLAPATTTGRKYVAAGFTPDGQAFEVSVGEGVETRVAEVFHSPAEARYYLQRLAASDPKGKMICVGQAGLRAGCYVSLPDGSKRRITKCRHEVRHEAWIVTAYLS
ncbi:MAG TPA: hypothetical protein GX517_11735, partial [Alicyclobacillus sp.]|nr:hypothetical protein [Alicyclobacillus sp.]